jgi:hypothetical protein
MTLECMSQYFHYTNDPPPLIWRTQTHGLRGGKHNYSMFQKRGLCSGGQPTLSQHPLDRHLQLQRFITVCPISPRPCYYATF